MPMNTNAISSLSAMRRRSPVTLRLCVWGCFWTVVVVAGVLLGLWQWERAADKQRSLDQRAAAPSLESPVSEPVEGATLRLHGEYLAANTLYLDNRILNGRLGVAVLTPLRDEHGQLWLIQRGFMETGSSREPPVSATPAGLVQVIGEWQVAHSDGLVYGNNLEGVRLQRLDLAPWTSALGEFRFAGWVHAQEGDGVLTPWWEANVVPPARHQAYAFQWWGLALAALAVMLIGGHRLMNDPRVARIRS